MTKIKVSLVFLVIFLITICIGLLFLLLNKKERSPDLDIQKPVVNIGMLRFPIVDSRAIERKDGSIKQVEEFLKKEAANSRCPNDRLGYEQVVAHTTDETQLFVRYGCGAADSPSFAVKIDNQRKSFHPPTNLINSIYLAAPI